MWLVGSTLYGPDPCHCPVPKSIPWKTPFIVSGGVGLSKFTVVIWALATSDHARPSGRLAMKRRLATCSIRRDPLPRRSELRARSSETRGRSQGAPRQIDDDVLGADRGKRMRRLSAGASDHQDFRVVEELVNVLAHQRRDVGDLLFDVTTIGADQSRERDARVEDSHVASLADECLDQRDHRTLPEVVGPRLEGQADDSHPALSSLEHPVYPSTNLRLVGWQDRGEHLRRHISRASGIEQRPKVL